MERRINTIQQKTHTKNNLLDVGFVVLLALMPSGNSKLNSIARVSILDLGMQPVVTKYLKLSHSVTSGKCTGNFKVICQGEGKVKASRLMSWWNEQKPASVDPLLFAEHCAKYIDKRGIKDCPPMEEAGSTVSASIPNTLEIEIQKLISLYGIEAVKKAISLQ